jgi:carbon-monoxide dehydrogenase large subunit
MGGGFGTRGGCEPEYSLCLWGSEVVGRPVKWVADRSEGFLTDEQGRGGLADAELVLDKDYRFLAIRTHTKVPIGAYYTTDRNFGSATGAFSGMTGPYRMPALHATVTGAFTNMIGNAQYRGGAKPEPVHILEVMIDNAARELGLDPAELRRINMIRTDELPYKNCMGDVYDCGEFIENMDTCLAAGEYSGFSQRYSEAVGRGKIRGIGLANSICGVATVNYEHAEVRFTSAGDVTLLCGAMDHGQGHQTVFRQILADRLGIDADRIQYRFGDTEKVSMGVGTFNARCATLAGSAVSIAADRVIEKGRRIAAHLLDADTGDVRFEAGLFNLKGSNRHVTLDDVAKAAFVRARLPADIEPGLYEKGDFGSTTGAVYPNGCHLAEVEIDLETGQLELVRYTCVDDAGTILNPLLFDGQIHGGIAQGVGQILMESVEYDRGSGQLLSGSFMDYAMPRANDFCHFELLANEVPTARNPLGVKGVGEAGTVGAMPALMNAVNDALHRVGVGPIEMPTTANKIWAALKDRAKELD